MDSITFFVGEVTVQLVGGVVNFWRGETDRNPDITLPIQELKNALSTAHMLIKDNNGR